MKPINIIQRINESSKHYSNVDEDYFDKFDDITDKYLPVKGEGESMASQTVAAINKLIYKWYNDGDVYDNVNSRMEGWANDLSDYANWLAENVDGAKEILDKILDLNYGDDAGYENILKDLADNYMTSEFLGTCENVEKTGSIYDCAGPYAFNEDGFMGSIHSRFDDDEDEEE